MAKVINLNKARKQKVRADAEKQAAGNRVRFGRTKVEKQRDLAEIKAAEKRLDQIQRAASKAEGEAPEL